MSSPYNIDEEIWVFKRPSVVEMKKQYEEMIVKINAGDPQPFKDKSSNIEKVMYLRRKRLQDKVPSEDKRPPKIFSRFSLSIPLTLKLKEIEPDPNELTDSQLDLLTNTKTIESLEDWWGDFHNHDTNIKYKITIGSLSIGDAAIVELAQKLNDLIAKMPARPLVQLLDVSWNDIYEEGAIALGTVLENLARLSEVRMDGNIIGTTGLQAILEALTKAQPQEKKRAAGSFKLGGVIGTPSSSPFGSPAWKRTGGSVPGLTLSLRETNIGDESTTTLASFLKPIPNCQPLNLVALDLTNTYIFDGITPLTLALQQNTILTSLTLNSNMIGDQGAFAIGELLLINRTLCKLEMRNCDIGPTGTSQLCIGLQGHRGLRFADQGAVFVIDMGLNPWDFSGELKLLQTTIAKPQMTINWREGEWIPTDEDELNALIRTFGETVILDMVMDGKGLLPLASPNQLIASPLIAAYAPIYLATIVDSLDPSKSTQNNKTHNSALPVLGIILQVMQEHGKNHYESWLPILPRVLAHLSSWMNPSLHLHVKHRRQIEVLTLDLLRVLGGITQRKIDDIIIKSKIMDLSLENFLAHPNHNVFHIHLIGLIETLCANTQGSALGECTLNLIRGKFFAHLQDILKEESCLTPRQRSGSFSASLMFVRFIEPYLDTRLMIPIKKLIKQNDLEQSGPLGGPPPDRSTQKIVLNKDSEI